LQFHFIIGKLLYFNYLRVSSQTWLFSFNIVPNNPLYCI